MPLMVLTASSILSVISVSTSSGAAPGRRVVTTTVEGRERHPVRVRYGRAFREDEESVRELPVLVRAGGHVPLSAVADVQLTEGPAASTWGYCTNGGTEGNMYGLFLARELHPEGLVYYSEDTHYSVNKILRCLHLTRIAGIRGVRERRLRGHRVEQEARPAHDPQLINGAAVFLLSSRSRAHCQHGGSHDRNR